MAGFYHDPTKEDPAVVICFSCEMEHQCIGTNEKYSNDIVKAVLLDFYVDACLWADIHRNTTKYFPTFTRPPQKIGMVGRERHLDSYDKKSVNFFIQIIF